MIERASTDYDCVSNRSLSTSQFLEIDSGFDDDDSIETDSNGDISSPSPEKDAWLAVAFAKHRMMVCLMKDFYTIFDSQWKPDVRSRTDSHVASTATLSKVSSPQTPRSAGRSKRKYQDRDSHPPDDNDEKKRKSEFPKKEDGGQERLFACFFYKHNTQKYCSNSDTGTKYRSCAGPGFSKISQLK